MNTQKLLELINMSESEKLDFKEDFSLITESSKKEFAKDVSAIANSKGGRGYIIFGVKDKTKEIIGVKTAKSDEERVHQIITSRCDPPVSIGYEEIAIKGKAVVVITIYKSDFIPHQIVNTGTFYIRRGSTTDVARKMEIASMLQDNGILFYELVPARSAKIEDLDFELLDKYILNNLTSDKNKRLLILEGMGFLTRIEGAYELCPTFGGLLIFGKSPQSFLPSTGIRFEYNDTAIYVEGNIPKMLNRCEELILEILRDTKYPVSAIYEVLYNAIVHRDYWDYTRDIVVSISERKIEVINPGALWKKEGAIYFDSDTNPPRRNNWLYQRLLLLDKNKRFLNNPGNLRCIYSLFPDGEKIKFVNSPKNNTFKVVLPGTGSFKKS